MIKNFIYPATIGALLILLLVIQCNKGKKATSLAVDHTIAIR